MVTFDPALPDTASVGDSGHVSDHNAIVAGLNALNAGKQEAGAGANGNLKFGADTQMHLTSGAYNTVVGAGSQNAVTTGSYNTALGGGTQATLLSGTGNNAFGTSVQTSLTSGSANNAFGNGAHCSLTSGGGQSAFGAGAGGAFTTGYYNLALGFGAGYAGTTETLSGVVVIGTDSSGAAAQATANNQFVLGTASHTVIVPGTLTVSGLSNIDAKGDLLVGLKNDTLVRLPSGASGTMIGYDAAAAAGVRSWTPNQIAVADPVFLSTITWPQAAGHRLGCGNYGEETIASADMSLAGGVRVLECDYEVSSDGDRFLMHDATIDRTTNGTGTVSAMTGAEVSQFRVDTGPVWGAGYSPQRIATLDEVTARYRGRAILVIEPKSTNDPAVQGPLWRKAGLTDTIIVQRWSLAECQAWAAQGFDTMYLTSADTDPATVIAAGVPWIGYAFTGTGTGGEIARVQAAKAAGLKVATWTHTRESHAYAARTAGSDMLMSDYPVHCNTTPGMQSVSFAKGIFAPSTFAVVGTQVVDAGMLHFVEHSSSEYSSLIGALGPIPNGTFTVYATFTCTSATVSDGNTHWGGIFLGGPRDTGYKLTDGYHALLRMNGTLQLFRYSTSGGASLLATTSTGALSVQTDYSLSLQVTPTGVKATRIDTGHTATAADTTYRYATWFPSWTVKQPDFTKMIGMRTMSVAYR